MAVILVNAQLKVRAHTHPSTVRDAHGTPMPSTVVVERGPLPGAINEQQNTTTRDGESFGPWSIRLDPALWPIEGGDVVVEVVGGVDARTWVVSTARLFQLAGGPSDVDYIAVTASLNPPRTP